MNDLIYAVSLYKYNTEYYNTDYITEMVMYYISLLLSIHFFLSSLPPSFFLSLSSLIPTFHTTISLFLFLESPPPPPFHLLTIFTFSSSSV